MIKIQQGVGHILAATFFFALMQICVKQVSHLPSVQVVSFRAGIGLVICVLQIKWTGGSLLGTHRKLLFLRGLAGTVALTAFFYTLQHIPLGTAVTLQYLSPLFTIMLATFLVQEPASLRQWLFFLLAFAGVFVIQGFDSRVDPVTAIIGVLSALGSGVAYNIIRLLHGKEDPMTIVLYFPLVTFPLILPFSWIYWQPPGGVDWLYLLGVGIFTQCAQVFMTLAYQRQKAANVAIFNYLGIVYAITFGYLIFGESVLVSTLVGIGLILVAVMGAMWQQKPLPTSKALS